MVNTQVRLKIKFLFHFVLHITKQVDGHVVHQEEVKRQGGHRICTVDHQVPMELEVSSMIIKIFSFKTKFLTK